MDVKSLLILNCFCLLILYFTLVVGGDAPYGLCVNAECSVPVSKGTTILRYASPDDNRISVEPNEEVLIYVKDYGPKKDLWGIIVRGNRGYISKQFIKETKLFAKSLVPAFFEFKTSILVPDPHTASSHLHVSSQFPQSDSFLSNAVPQSVQHTHSVQHDFSSSAPGSVQQEWSGHSENLQASHVSPTLNPSHDMPVNSYSQFDQSSQLYNIPEDSSHFHLDSGHVLSSSHTIGVKSGNILPSPTHVPNVKQSPPYQSFPNDPMLTSQDFHSSLYSVPNSHFPQTENFGPSSVLPSQSYNQHPSSIQPQQQFHSPRVPEMHSSSYSLDYDDYDDMSKTYAMLSNLGFDNTGMYINQELAINPGSYVSQEPHINHESHVYQSSQNVERNFDSSTAQFHSFPSQSQYPPVQESGSSVYSSINLNPQDIHGNKLVNSDIPKEFASSNDEPSENVFEKDKVTEKLMEEDSEEEENDESDILEADDGTDENADDEGEDEEEEIINSSVDDAISSLKDTEAIDSGFNLQSSMSSTQINQQTSKREKDIPSSENSITESSLPSAVVETSIEEKTGFPSSELLSSSVSSMQLETEVSEDNKISHSTVQSNIVDSSVHRQIKSSDSLNLTKDGLKDTANMVSNSITPIVDKKTEVVKEVFSKKEIFSDIPDRNNNEALPAERTIEHTTPKINDFFVKSEQNSEAEKIFNAIDIDRMGEDLATYQVRNLKGEFTTSEEQQSDSDGGNDENSTQSESDSYSSFGNWFDALKSVVDSIMSWIPEPLYSALMDLQNKGISPRVPVFTALCGFISIFLIVPIFYIKEWSKESRLSAQLASVEKKAYAFSATNIVLEEKLESVQTELVALQASLAEEKTLSENLNIELENQAGELEGAKSELEGCLEAIDALKDKEDEYLTVIEDYKKEKEYYLEHKESLDKIMKDQENSIANLTDQLQESENKIEELEKEKEQFSLLKADYEEKLAQFDRNCNQLLQEAEVWNLRVTQLTEEVNEERTAKEQLMETLKAKDEEIESLKELVETFKILDEIEDPEEQSKTKEEKLQSLLNSSMIVTQLKKEEEKSKLLDEQLGKEKSKILDMEVELLDAKSEIDKLKISYNQALQDKAEAQTKLDVLTNYFKDKEIQLQKQLGAQEAVRQKKEEDANSAERRICLIEQENASYKYQVASMKQEMEETERNLKSQIAAQEKKAHENWIAARAAERKLEDMKQEVTQLHQRLTLLEREQENWNNAARDEIIRPVPKRMPGVNDESASQDLNASERGMFPPPPIHDRLPPPPPPHMMLPPDRPLPPLPPLIPPVFLPHMERHFRPQPWHMPPEPGSDYRTTPPEFMQGRESTPPRGRQSAITDGDAAMHTSSPLTTDTRDSRNSTPPHLLPDFHDVPPQPGRPFYPPPPLGRPRFPVHPSSYRRDAGPEPKRLDNPNEYNSRGSQQPPEQWQHSRV